jgi:large subunit ribosomal protein L21
MYAVVTTGGKQYRVEAGGELTIERLAADAGSSVTFDRVLLLGDGDSVTVGTPVVDGATVTATVLADALGPKLRIFKFKQKVKYRRTSGHRQHLTRVRIDEINAPGKARRSSARADATDAEASAETPKPRRTRRSAAKAEATEPAAPTEATTTETPKPRRTRKPAAPKADAAPAEAQAESKTQE